jgi:diguanylate cyclase (GGDEF)-like protein
MSGTLVKRVRLRLRGTGPFTPAHVAYVFVLTVVSCAWLAALLMSDPRLLTHPLRHHVVAFLTFLTLAVASRMMALPVAGTGSFGLDTSVFVATLLTLGVGPAITIILIATLGRGLFDWIRRSWRGVHWPFSLSLLRLFFGPALTAAILSLLGLVVSPEAFASEMKLQVVHSVGLFLGTTAGLVLPQFTLMVISYRLNGIPWRTLLADVVGPGLLAELAFVPMGFALTFSYRDRDPLTLTAVAVSYVIFTYVFRRMWRNSESLREQARELEVVEEAGRATASTLDIAEIGRRIGTSLLAAIDRAQGVVLTVATSEAGEANHLVRAVDRRDKSNVVLAARWSLHRELGVPSESLPDGDLPVTSPLESPVISLALPGQGGTAPLGWLSVVLRPGTRVIASDRRLCEHLSRQGTIAITNWRLYTLATEDGLTGMFVRRYVEARIREEFERSVRSGGSFCLLMIDVDNLKSINDRHGHAAGDRLLQSVAQGVRASVRGMDVPGRWGGDEFAVLLPEMEIDEGTEVAKRLANEVGLRSFQIGTSIVIPSVSIGIAACPECDPSDPEALIDMADTALYSAKKSTKKGFVVRAPTAQTGTQTQTTVPTAELPYGLQTDVPTRHEVGTSLTEITSAQSGS